MQALALRFEDLLSEQRWHRQYHRLAAAPRIRTPSGTWVSDVSNCTGRLPPRPCGSARREVLRRVETATVLQHLEVDMGSRGSPRAPKLRDHLALLDDVAGFNLNGFVVRVARGNALAVFDLDHLPVGARIPHERDDTAGDGPDVAARPAGEVDAVMPRGLAGDRVDARAVP